MKDVDEVVAWFPGYILGGLVASNTCLLARWASRGLDLINATLIVLDLAALLALPACVGS